MGRPPCCERSGVKKGPWSPEEDLLLFSYVQEHGPKNWCAVPSVTGLRRCGKSCRLRWTNYLRPGIKRGNFNNQEEKLIIELQKLLGNKWSTIASYMKDRTNNDIKNYWNSDIRKKLAKTSTSESGASSSAGMKGQWEWQLQTNIHTARQALQEALSINTVTTPPAIKPEPEPLPLAQLPAPAPAPAISPAIYPLSIENIARLLVDWMCPSTSAVSGGGEGVSRSPSGTVRALESFTGMTKVEGMGGAGPRPSSSLPMLESWLLDDGMGHGDASLFCMPLVDSCEFF